MGLGCRLSACGSILFQELGGLTEGNDCVGIGDTEKEHGKDGENVLYAVMARGNKDGTVVEYQRC